jgi:hypothetical protein
MKVPAIRFKVMSQACNGHTVKYLHCSFFQAESFLIQCVPLAGSPGKVGLQKQQKYEYNTFACHACNEVRLCVLEFAKRKLATRKYKIKIINTKRDGYATCN